MFLSLSLSLSPSSLSKINKLKTILEKRNVIYVYSSLPFLVFLLGTSKLVQSENIDFFQKSFLYGLVFLPSVVSCSSRNPSR